MRGKNKCKILKEIRRRIADENDIPYVTSECKYQGECSGTCPKCESELRYLERELEKKQKLGKTVTLAGVAVTMALSLSSCEDILTTSGDPLPPGSPSGAIIETSVTNGVMPPPDGTEVTGEIIESEPGGAVPIPGDIAAPVSGFELLADMSAEEIYYTLESYSAEEIKNEYSKYLSTFSTDQTTGYQIYTYAGVSVASLSLTYGSSNKLIEVEIRAVGKNPNTFSVEKLYDGVPMMPEITENE